MAQGDYIFPIPGTKRLKYLNENINAIHVTLEPAELEKINALFPVNAAEGSRYPDSMKGSLNG
jgi:aryl-alcohol dehydrogenase-like predicted oxidoreductase